MEETKNPVASKTIWFNAAIAAAVAAAPVLSGLIPVEFLALATPLVNIALRWLTNKRISL